MNTTSLEKNATKPRDVARLINKLRFGPALVRLRPSRRLAMLKLNKKYL